MVASFIEVNAQKIIVGDEVIVGDSIRIDGEWLSGIITDTSFTAASDSEIATAKAVKDFVSKEILQHVDSSVFATVYRSDTTKANLRNELANVGVNIEFGAFTSVEFGNEDVTKLTAAVADYNSNTNINFVVNIGDFIERTVTSNPQALLDLDTIEAVYDDLTIPRYYALGNHDLDALSKTEYIAGTGMGTPYYSFDSGNFHFVVLDPLFRSDDDGDPYDTGNFDFNTAYIPPDERTWLTADLAATGKPVIVFCEYNLEGAYAVTNASAIRTILEADGNVIAIFTGHEGLPRYTEINGIKYIGLQAMDGAATNAYSIVKVYADNTIEIIGLDDQPYYPRQLETLKLVGGSQDIPALTMSVLDNLSGLRMIDFNNSSDLFRMGIEYDNPGVALDIVDRGRVSLLRINESSGDVSINAGSTNTKLAVSDVDGPVFQSERTSSITTGLRTAGRILHTTDQVMADGFGSTFALGIRSGAGSIRDIGQISVVRDGSDTQGKMLFGVNTAGNIPMVIASNENVGIGAFIPTAALHLKAGIATAGFAPLKFTNGALTTVAEAGAMEMVNTNFYLTNSSGVRNISAMVSGETPFIIGSIPFVTNSGYLLEDNSNFFWDNSGKELGIGTTTPDGKVHIMSGSAGSVTANTSADEVVIENSTHGGLTFLTPNTATAAIYFGDVDDNNAGRINYSHGSDQMEILVNSVVNGGATALLIESDMDVAVPNGSILASGDITAEEQLYVKNAANQTTSVDSILTIEGGEIKTNHIDDVRGDMNIFSEGATFTVTAPAADTIKDLGGSTTSSIGGTFQRVDDLVEITVSFLVYTAVGTSTSTIVIDPPAPLASDFTSTIDARVVGGNLIQSDQLDFSNIDSRVRSVSADTVNDDIDVAVYYGNGGTGAPANPGNRYEVTVTIRYLIQ